MDVEAVRKGFAKFSEQFDKDPSKQHFTYIWRQSLEIVSAEKTSDSTAKIVYRFPVQHEYLNPAGGFHGGAAATFFDIGTSCLTLMIARPGFWDSGTSRTLNVTYIRPAQKGEMLLMECEIVHAGKRLCLLKGTLRRESDGAVISVCEHNKAYIGSPKV